MSSKSEKPIQCTTHHICDCKAHELSALQAQLAEAEDRIWDTEHNEAVLLRDLDEARTRLAEAQGERPTEKQAAKKWYGKLVYSREGVETYHEFETEAEAKAYALGIQDTIDIAEQDTDHNSLEDYFGCYDQDEPRDE